MSEEAPGEQPDHFHIIFNLTKEQHSRTLLTDYSEDRFRRNVNKTTDRDYKRRQVEWFWVANEKPTSASALLVIIISGSENGLSIDGERS